MNSPPRFSGILKTDLPAAVVVFLVALPLCLGIALASGAPLISGLIAGIVGGVVVGSLSGSPLGVSGPAAGLAVIVLTAIQDLGAFDILLVSVILAGLIQIALGFARAGVIAYYFPSSVIKGMLAGIGVIIVLKQIPHALGYDRDPEGDFSFNQFDGNTTFSELTQALDVISTGPLLIALVSLAILVAWDTQWVKGQKFLAVVPGPLLAVVTGVLLTLAFRSMPSFALAPDQLVNLPVANGLDGLTDLLTFPDFSALSMGAVYKTAIVLAVVASLETLLCVEATDKLDPRKRITPTNRELKAQGVGNVISACLGGLPVTQVIVRSSANIQSGGQSKVSAIVHGLLLLVSALALPGLMNQIPLATLAAVLLVVGYKLAKPALFRKMYHEGWAHFIPFAATVAGIVFTDLLVGVGIGLAIAVVGLLLENFQLPFQMEQVPHQRGEKVRMVLAQQVSFLNKASVLHSLNSIPNDSTVEIDGRASVYVHGDVIEIIDDFAESAKSRNIQVIVEGLEHHQKGRPGAGSDITVTPPSPLPPSTNPHATEGFDENSDERSASSADTPTKPLTAEGGKRTISGKSQSQQEPPGTGEHHG